MSKKSRLERIEEKLNLGEKERRILTELIIDAGKVDLPGFPYEDSEECKSYQTQIKEKQEKEPDKEVWIVTVGCKDCKEKCKFAGMVIGIGKDKK